MDKCEFIKRLRDLKNQINGDLRLTNENSVIWTVEGYSFLTKGVNDVVFYDESELLNYYKSLISKY
jgi:hypothetical protein